MNILKRPMFYAAAISCAAVALSVYIKTFALIFLLVAIILFSALALFKKHKFIVIGLALILLLVNLFFQYNKIEKANSKNGRIISGNFLVSAPVVEYDEYNTITLKIVDNDVLPQNIKVLVFDYKKASFKMGDVVKAKIQINSIDKNDKYRLSNYGNGIYATSNIKTFKIIGSNFFYKTAGNVREYIKNTFLKHFDNDTAGLLCAVTIGDKTMISKAFSHNIKTTGISHIVVVSGMHLSIIMVAILFVADRLFYNKYIRCLLIVLSIVFIAAICGFTMSVIRAGATFIVASLAPIFNRDNDYLNSLFTAVTVILIVDPFAILNISFLLSFTSTLAIVWIVPFYSKCLFKLLKIKSKLVQTIISMVLCCVFANIFTLPITIKTFGYVSLVSPITNLCITYFITISLILNIIAIVLCAIPFIDVLGGLVLALSGICSHFCIFIVNQIASLPITVAILPKNAYWISILIIGGIVALMYYIDYRSKKKEVNKCQ